jgi:hypothetical protein
MRCCNRAGWRDCHSYWHYRRDIAPSQFRVINGYIGKLPPMPGVFPDYPAPVRRNRARNGQESRVD